MSENKKKKNKKKSKKPNDLDSRIDSLTDVLIDQNLSNINQPAPTKQTLIRYERLKKNLQDELESYAIAPMLPLFDKKQTFEPPISAISEVFHKNENMEHLKLHPLRLVLRIDLSSPNKIKHFQNDKISCHNSDFTLPAILSFFLLRLLDESTTTRTQRTKSDKADSNCPFKLIGLQQISTNTSFILALIEPDINIDFPQPKDRSYFIRNVQKFLKRYKAHDLFFPQLDHHFQYDGSSMDMAYSTKPCHLLRKMGQFDSCIVLPHHIDNSTPLSSYIQIDESHELQKIFERQPSLLINHPPGYIEGDSILSLNQWPVLASGYGLLKEPRIVSELFARLVLDAAVDVIGLRLMFPNLKTLTESTMKTNCSSYYRSHRQQYRDHSQVFVPTLALVCRGYHQHHELQRALKRITGVSDLEIAKINAKQSSHEHENCLNGKYADFFQTDESYMWTPSNQGSGHRTLATYFGGRLTPVESLQSGEKIPDGHDKLLDLIRENEKEKLTRLSPVIDINPDNQIKESTVSTVQEDNQKVGTKKGKKKKKKSAQKSEDIDALVAELGLEVSETPTTLDSLYYTVCPGLNEKVCLIISPVLESHNLAFILQNCLDFGFKVESIQSVTLDKTKVPPYKINLESNVWQYFYPDIMYDTMERYFNHDHDQEDEIAEKVESEYHKIGNDKSMEARASYILTLTRENAYAHIQAVISSLFKKIVVKDRKLENLAKNEFDRLFKQLQELVIAVGQNLPGFEDLDTLLSTCKVEYDLNIKYELDSRITSNSVEFLDLETVDEHDTMTTQLSKIQMLEEEAEELTILLYTGELNHQFNDILDKLSSIDETPYAVHSRRANMSRYGTINTKTYPLFELIGFRSFPNVNFETAQLLNPYEHGDDNYWDFIDELTTNSGCLVVFRAISAKQKLAEYIDYKRQQGYVNTSDLYYSVEPHFPFHQISSTSAILRILPLVGKLHGDSSTRSVVRFLAPKNGDIGGHHPITQETFSFLLIRPHAIKASLPPILARLASAGFEVVAMEKVRVAADEVDDIGACKIPPEPPYHVPMIRELWSRELLESDCVVIVVKRVNAVYQLYRLLIINRNGKLFIVIFVKFNLKTQ